MTDKQMYRVPSMAEIAAIQPIGLTVASTFSGCGGSSLGYRMAGFRVLWANEFVSAARDTYRANAAPYTVLDGRDIREVTAASVLAACGLTEGQLDVLDGSPPCASFSTAGKREAGWGKVKKYSDTNQRTDDLFYEYARLLRGIQPRTFVAENVSGLIKGTAKGYFLRILAELRGCGYRVTAKVLDAQWLGVPQARQRLIFVGVREDIGREPVHPTPLTYRYTIRDALPGGVASTVDFETGANISMRRYAIGSEWNRLRPGAKSDKYLSLVRPNVDAPCPTVTARGGDVTAASVTHSSECRKFTLGELRRICGFPDDFVLTGSYEQRWERLGRAVPPVMMAAIASAIRDRVLTSVEERAA